VSVAPVLEGRGSHQVLLVKHGRGIFPGTARLFAVDDVTIALAAGTVTALVGESGSGKTTVARMLAKIINPDGGAVLLDGKPVPHGRPAVTRGRSRWSFRTLRLAQPDPPHQLQPGQASHHPPSGR